MSTTEQNIQTATPSERAFRSHFPDYLSMIAKDGTRFSFTNNYIRTADPRFIEELERAVQRGDVEEVSLEWAPEVPVKTAASRVPVDMGKPGTITPEDLQARIAAAKAAQGEKSAQLEPVAANVQRASTGITSTANIAKNSANSDTSSK